MDEEASAGRVRRRTIRHRVLAGLAVFLVLLGFLWQRCGLRGCPNVARLTSYQPGGATVLLDTTGDEYATLAPVAHEIVALESLPPHVADAFIAVEDKRFPEHNGVDYRRVVGAALADVRAGGFVQGFSTITMQLARNVWPDRLPGQRRTLRRKVLEVRVAYDIERSFTKQEILQLYLNHIYFGGGAYGIEAASRNYFNKSARNLTLAEAAVLAALPKSPTNYNPRRFAERARTRRDLVLSLMAQQGRVTAEEAERARATRLAVRREPPQRREEAGTAPYFVEAARRILEDHFGEDVYTAPLRVHTTLDRRAQRIAEQQLEQQLRAVERGSYGSYGGARYNIAGAGDDGPEYVQGAVVLMEAATGDVRALVGGRDFLHSRFDRATQARRQAGSAFKPFVYAAALAEGYAPSQLVSDSVLRMELAGGEVWEPRNVGGENEGLVTVREALVRSKNVPTIRLAADVGIADVTRLARRAGVRSELPNVPSVAIGTAAVTPLELTASFTPFAALGTSAAPRLITLVEDANGRVVWRPRPQSRQVLDSAVAYLVTNMLAEAVSSGTAAAVRRTGYRGPAAGKTGTTNDGADAWFVGYTPTLVGTVWIGFDRPAAITGEATGGRLAAPVWGRIMRDYTPRAESWQRPSTIVEHEVDPATGLILIDGCRPESGRPYSELFVRSSEPAAICPAGEPTHIERGLLRRVGDWFGRQWRRVGRWVTRHVGTEEPQPTPRDGDFLGVPRLPRAVEIDAPQIDTSSIRPVPLGTPWPIQPPDTIRRDTLTDTMRVDTIRTIRVDTPRVDTLRVDTLRVDTTRTDTLTVDTIADGGSPMRDS